MPALTPEKARAAFQNAIPRMRDEFAKRIQARLKSIAHESQYPLRYPAEVLQMAQEEVRSRAKLAADRIKTLIDSGWNPALPNGVASAFNDMYSGFDDWRKEPSSDLTEAVQWSFGAVGRNDPQQARINALELGGTQVQTMNEHQSDLEFYYAAHGSPSPPPGKPLSETAARPNNYECDAFISHASEDKETFVTGLAEELERRGLKIWFDAFTLRVGDSLREKIDYGLSNSRFGIIVLSPNFFAKSWPNAELNALHDRQMRDGRKVILPVWHNLDHDQIARRSPLVAGLLATNSALGLKRVADDLLNAIRDDAS